MKPAAYIDANVLLGHWPFHTLPRNDADSALRLMERVGVAEGMASSLESVYCAARDLPEVNERLYLSVREHSGKLHPFYTLHPAMPDAARELARLRRERGMAGARLYPAYHGYSLREARIDACLDKAAELDVPVYVAFRFEDERVHHPRAVVPAVALDELADCLSRHPRVTWIVGGIRIFEAQELLERCRHPRVYIDMSFIQTPFRSLERLVAAVGADRVLFGTGLPYWTPECALLKTTAAALAPEQLAQIAWRNARHILTSSGGL